MEPTRTSHRGAWPARTVALAGAAFNLAAFAASAMVGLRLDNLTLLAGSAHPLASIGLRGMAGLRGQPNQSATAGRSKPELWFCLGLLACSCAPLLGYLATSGAHNLFRTRAGDVLPLFSVALVLFTAAGITLLSASRKAEADADRRTDALLGLASACVCLVAALAASKSPMWMQDGISAMLVMGTWEARILLWALKNMFSP